MVFGFSIFDFRRLIYQAYAYVAQNARLCRIKEYIANNDSFRPSEPLEHGFIKPPSLWNPGDSKNTVLEKYLIALEAMILGPIEQQDDESQGCRCPTSEDLIIKSLLNDSSIVIRRADKGAKFCILDVKDYITEALSTVRDNWVIP